MYTVLIVEDEDIIRGGIRNSAPWGTFGCTVMGEVRSGEEGVALIEQLTLDIVITDINMPAVDGLQMLSQTREAFDYIAIILTGCSDFRYIRGTIHHGVVYYVLKPLSTEEMRRALEKAMLEVKDTATIRRQTESIHQLKNVSLLPAPDSREEMGPVTDQVLNFTTANYERKLSLADLETELHYSERYINQCFQKAMGTTVTDYLNRYRIQKALSLLKEYEIPVSDIGQKCSIGDCKYFHYMLRKYMGRSPKDYQANIKSRQPENLQFEIPDTPVFGTFTICSGAQEVFLCIFTKI